MLHRKIYQLCCDEREVWVFLRDQQRWIERAKVLDIEGDLVTLRYEVDEDDEVCAWEELIRLDSIGSISQKLSTVSRLGGEPLVSEDCPEAERIVDVRPEAPSSSSDIPMGEAPTQDESHQEVEPISERRPDGNAEA